MARWVTLVEVPDGFTIRYQERADGLEIAAASFARRDLVSRDIQQEQLRLQMQDQDEESRRSALDALPPPQVPGGYQDFLRALGYELDQSPIYYIALDEAEESTIITYLHLDPRHDFLPHKKMVVLSPEDKEALLQDAYARRQRTSLAQEEWEPSRIFG
jgi:hypothetical protein